MFVHGVSPNFSKIDGLFVSTTHQYANNPVERIAQIRPVSAKQEQGQLKNDLWQKHISSSISLLENINELIYQNSQSRPSGILKNQGLQDRVGFNVDQLA